MIKNSFHTVSLVVGTHAYTTTPSFILETWKVYVESRKMAQWVKMHSAKLT